MEYIVRSAAGAHLQTSTLFGKQLQIKENSSLNQKFNIQPNTALSNSDVVFEKYVVIGNGGHTFVTGPNGVGYPKKLQHTPDHAGLYGHLPFVLRLPNNDLAPAIRDKYRLRRTEQHNGVNYVAYYAKVLDLSQTQPTLELRTINNGVVTSTPFNYTLANLNPVPPVIPPGSVLVASSDSIVSTAKVPFTMSLDDINELLNVSNILFGTDELAIISEIGLAHGVDRAVTGDFNGIPASYTEVIGCQITTFVSTFYAVNFMNSAINVKFDTGSVENLLSLTQP